MRATHRDWAGASTIADDLNKLRTQQRDANNQITKLIAERGELIASHSKQTNEFRKFQQEEYKRKREGAAHEGCAWAAWLRALPSPATAVCAARTLRSGRSWVGCDCEPRTPRWAVFHGHLQPTACWTSRCNWNARRRTRKREEPSARCPSMSTRSTAAPTSSLTCRRQVLPASARHHRRWLGKG